MSNTTTPSKEALLDIHADRRVFKVSVYIYNKDPLSNAHLKVYYISAKDDKDARKKAVKYDELFTKDEHIVFCTIELVCTLIDRIPNESND